MKANVVVMDVSGIPYFCNILLLGNILIVIELSTCNNVSVTGIAKILWMDMHLLWYRNNHIALFLWTNLHQHFACVFAICHVPTKQILHTSV
jgi:hypothetical protein